MRDHGKDEPMLIFRAFPFRSRYPLYLFCTIFYLHVKLHIHNPCEINSRNNTKSTKKDVAFIANAAFKTAVELNDDHR